MKRILLILLPLILCAENLSPDALAILHGKTLATSPNVTKIRSGNMMLSGMILINDDFDKPAFHKLGGEILTSTDEVCTVRLPYSSLGKLRNIAGLRLFSPSRKLKPAMDKALPSGGVINVHDGNGFSQAYTGKGVVIGVVDGGFDFTHPSFRDLNDNVRISRVWDQVAAGTPPAGYNYGAVYETQEAILKQKLCSNRVSKSHGCHVAGIAAGSEGLPSEGSGGVAPEAELVFVSTNFYDNGLVDGMRYIFDYAESVNKPAVVNLSLGSHFGPHDGSSSVDRIIEAFSGEGKIVVGAAGNERTNQCHLIKKSGESSIKSFVTIFEDDSEERDGGIQQLNIWGEKDSSFSLRISLYDQNNSVKSSSVYSLHSIAAVPLIQEGFEYAGETVIYQLFGTTSSPLNGKPEVVVQFQTSKGLIMHGTYRVALEISGQGEVHAWTLVNPNGGKGFQDNSYPGMAAGDTSYTVGEVGGTGRKTISVGAYTTKTEFRNYSGVMEDAFGGVESEIAPFSSMGPTVDQRVKPDIAAPGDVIIAPLRSDFTDYSDDDKISNWLYQYGENYPYGGYSGTSMAAPFVTGAVALMLQADHTLSPSDVKDILKATASQSSTGPIPSEGSNIWGAGKINVDEAVKMVEDQRSAAPPMPGGLMAPRLRSVQSGRLELQIETSVTSKVNVRIMDLRGRELVRVSSSASAGVNNLPLTVNSLAPGVYLYHISGVELSSFGKLAHLK